MIKKYYVDRVEYDKGKDTEELWLMKLDNTDAAKKSELFEQLVREHSRSPRHGKSHAHYGGSHASEQYNKISGPIELYTVPGGEHKLGDVLDKLPENAVPIKKPKK